MNFIVCDQADDAGKEDDLRVILAEVRYNGLDGLTGGQEDGFFFHAFVIKLINEICVDILSRDFGMKEFLDFELLHCEFLWILKLSYSFPIYLAPP